MLKSLLDALLKVLYLRIGQATSTGATLYSLPTIPEDSTGATTTINAPGDGYFLLRAWYLSKGVIYNKALKHQSENRYLGSGVDVWDSTHNMSVYFYVACSKGDPICVEIVASSGATPQGSVVFFPRLSPT